MIELRPLFQLKAIVSEAQIIPDGPYGVRRFIPVAGGTFKGDRITGEVLAGGADCQLIRPDGVAELDIRVTLRTNEGATFLVKGSGLRHGSDEVLARIASGEVVDGSEYYFRESLVFEAPQGSIEWLNRIVAIAAGEKKSDHVQIDTYEVL